MSEKYYWEFTSDVDEKHRQNSQLLGSVSEAIHDAKLFHAFHLDAEDDMPGEVKITVFTSGSDDSVCSVWLDARNSLETYRKWEAEGAARYELYKTGHCEFVENKKGDD